MNELIDRMISSYYSADVKSKGFEATSLVDFMNKDEAINFLKQEINNENNDIIVILDLCLIIKILRDELNYIFEFDFDELKNKLIEKVENNTYKIDEDNKSIYNKEKILKK